MGAAFGTAATTRGPGNKDSNPRPNARLFSTFSFAKFSAAAIFVINPLHATYVVVPTLSPLSIPTGQKP
jgi:hypothetical protein